MGEHDPPQATVLLAVRWNQRSAEMDVTEAQDEQDRSDDDRQHEQPHCQGFFVEALKYGTPPHLGFAFGLDRLVMLLSKTENIRDVIAFPKTQKASDLMMNCPSQVDPKQLDELKLRIVER